MVSRRRQMAGKHQPVEAVIINRAGKGCQESLFQRRLFILQINRSPIAMGKLHVMQDNRRFIAIFTQANFKGPLGNDIEAEIFQKRHPARQGKGSPGMKDLQGNSRRAPVGCGEIRWQYHRLCSLANTGQIGKGLRWLERRLKIAARISERIRGCRKERQSVLPSVVAIARIALSSLACGIFGVLPPERPMMK